MNICLVIFVKVSIRVINMGCRNQNLVLKNKGHCPACLSASEGHQNSRGVIPGKQMNKTFQSSHRSLHLIANSTIV